MILITMKMALNKMNMTMMLGKYNVGHVRMREVIYKLFKDLEGLLKHCCAWPQNEIKEHFAKHHLKSKLCDKTLEQFTDNSLSIAEMMLFISFEGKKLHSHDAVTFS